MVQVKPITTCEFITMLQRCKPPTGWPRKLAIANSGGPDSTCLLFLLNNTLRKIKEQDAKAGGWFGELVSLNVDHQLQTCSPEMSLKASKISCHLGVPHRSLHVPWGSPPYATKPSSGQSFERIARDARYTLLLSGMRQHGVDAIAFGHHADDQLETLLMRLANGTGFLGLGGMKHVRRFGMGDGSPGQMGWYGMDGMQRWMIRPLLGVPKSRVFATCEEHGLDYVTDETNFQPEITLRNAVRHALTTGDISDNMRHDRALQKITANAERLDVPLTLPEGIESLRGLASYYASEVARIETEANASLRDCTLPSPPSTVLLSREKLSRIKDTLVQRSMVLQTLRFVSPHPWGSHAAEGFRKSDSLNRIVFAVFDDAFCGKTAFSAGSHVLWTPVYVRPDGQIRYTKPVIGVDGWTEGWLVSRSPPYKTTSGTSELETDITPLILDKQSFADPIDILYDNRFVLTFHPWKTPAEVFKRLRVSPPSGHRLLVTATKKYFLPRLVFQPPSGDVGEAVGMGKSESGLNILPMTNVLRSSPFAGTDWADWRLVRLFE